MREAIEKLVQEELDRANAKFPPFSSRHEGYAVLLEEVEEAEEDLQWIKKILSADLWKCIRENLPTHHDKCHTNAIFRIATDLAIEALQVAAMALKYQALLGADNEPKD